MLVYRTEMRGRYETTTEDRQVSDRLDALSHDRLGEWMISNERRVVSFRDYRDAVAGQIDAGFPFGEVEDFIEACAIDDEQKSALWLWAWVHQPPQRLRAFAESHVLRLVHATSGDA
jgi:hypothetical protein